MDERSVFSDFQADNVEHFIKQIEQYDKDIAPTMRANGYKCKNKARRTVLFTFGEVTFCRNRWYKGDKCRIPVDEKFGLEKHTRYSLELLYQIAELSTDTPYRKVVKTVDMMYHLQITKDTVLKAVRLAERLLKEKEDYRFFKEEQPIKKIKVKFIYIEGDGVMVKSYDEIGSKNLDLSHFIIHTGAKNGKLLNKKEIITLSNRLARNQVLDYLYQHYEITPETILITNSDGGKGYTPYIFKDIAKALGVQRHEHFWDAYHVHKKLRDFYRPYSPELLELAFETLKEHDKQKLRLVLDTTESLIETEKEKLEFEVLLRQFRDNFQYTKPAKLRGLPEAGIGVMESQHRKLTYRMKNRGMYWSVGGADTMSQLILLSTVGELRDLFFGSWREEYEKMNDSNGMSATKARKYYYVREGHTLPQARYTNQAK